VTIVAAVVPGVAFSLPALSRRRLKARAA